MAGNRSTPNRADLLKLCYRVLAGLPEQELFLSAAFLQPLGLGSGLADRIPSEQLSGCVSQCVDMIIKDEPQEH